MRSVWALALLALQTRLAASQSVSDCPGYQVSNYQTSGNSITADLTLAGTACNVYGNDITNLKLLVEYQSRSLSPGCPHLC